MKAEEIFARVPKTHNCAQSVAAGCGHEELVEELGKCGGGRAPQGLCGALYAALLLLPEQERETARQEFIRKVGAADCRTIKKQTGTPCSECVAVAAALCSGKRGI